MTTGQDLNKALKKSVTIIECPKCAAHDKMVAEFLEWLKKVEKNSYKDHNTTEDSAWKEFLLGKAGSFCIARYVLTSRFEKLNGGGE